MKVKSAVWAAGLAAVLTFVPLPAAVLGEPAPEGTIAQEPPPAKAKVLVKDNYFEPRSVEITDDGHVGWKWRGVNKHNIRFTKVPRGASRKGARTRTDGYWKRTFHRPGAYRYVCKHWAGMRGTVIVRSAPET
jgi:plastocyanin